MGGHLYILPSHVIHDISTYYDLFQPWQKYISDLLCLVLFFNNADPFQRTTFFRFFSILIVYNLLPQALGYNLYEGENFYQVFCFISFCCCCSLKYPQCLKQYLTHISH